MGTVITPPSVTPNPNEYGVKTSDAQVQRAIAYLSSLGAPTPVAADVSYPYPGGGVVWDSTLTWTDNQGHSSTQIAGLVGDYPNVAANVLAAAGIIKLTAPLSDAMPVPSVNIDAFPQVQMVQSPALGSPIGAKIPIGVNPAADMVGDEFYLNPLYHLSIGTTWTENGKTYVLKGVVNMFGSSIYWVRTA